MTRREDGWISNMWKGRAVMTARRNSPSVVYDNKTSEGGHLQELLLGVRPTSGTHIIRGQRRELSHANHLQGGVVALTPRLGPDEGG